MRSAYLGDRGGKDHHLIQLTNALHELVDAGPLDDIDIMVLSLDLYGDSEVGLMQYLEKSESKVAGQEISSHTLKLL